MKRLLDRFVPAVSIAALAVYLLACVLVGPAWSPDGKSFAFLLSCAEDYAKGKPYQLWIAGPEGKARHVETNDRGLGGPSWSPDGKWIAWLSGDEVVLWDVEKGERKTIEKVGAFEEKDAVVYGLHRLAWAPDSSWIAGCVLKPDDGSGTKPEDRLVFKRWDLPSGKTTVLCEQADFLPGEVSPDGKWILGSENLGDGRDQKRLVLMASSGDERRQLIPTPSAKGISSFFAWSPDSQSIVFSCDESEGGQGTRRGLLFVGLDGAEVRFLPSPSDDTVPMVCAWPKNGKGILGVAIKKEEALADIAWIEPEKGAVETIATIEGYPFAGCAGLSPAGDRIAYCVSGKLDEGMNAWRVRMLADGTDRMVWTTAENAAWFLEGMKGNLTQAEKPKAFDRIRAAALRDAAEASAAFPDDEGLKALLEGLEEIK